MKVLIFAVGILLLVACSRREPAAETQISMSLFDGLSSSDPSEQEASLSTAKITPYGAQLSKDELLRMNVIFLQLVANAQASQRPIPVLRSDSDLYASIRRSLTNIPGWYSLENQATKDGKLELHALAALIEAAHQSRPGK